MPDSITPVGTMYAQQNPIAALSSIYGIQQQQVGLAQQKQNLQTGVYQQQSAQAGAQQDQMKASQAKAVSNLVQNADKYKGADGNFDNQKFANDASTVAPLLPELANSATMRAGEVYKNKQTLMDLTNSERATIGNALGSWAADPTMNHTKLIDGVEGLRDQFKGNPDVSRLLTSMTTAMPNQDGPGLQQSLRNAAVMANAPTQAQTNPSVGTYQGVGGVQPYQNNPQAPGGIKNIGAPLGPQGLSPTDQPGYKATVANVTAGSAARGAGGGNADITTSNNVVAGQKDARTNIDLTKRIDQLADIVSPGAVASKVSQGLGALGLQDVNQARTELQKDLGRLRGPLAARAASDDRAGELLSGLPTDTTPTQTIHQAMDVQRGAAKQDLALGALRDKAAAATSGNMNGFQSQYSHAVGAASPLMHEYWSLPKEQQAQFLKRNSSSPQQAQELRNRYEAARSQLNVGQ